MIKLRLVYKKMCRVLGNLYKLSNPPYKKINPGTLRDRHPLHMAYIKCDLDHKVPSIYDNLYIESKNTLDMTYIKGYSFPVHIPALCLRN